MRLECALLGVGYEVGVPAFWFWAGHEVLESLR